MPVIVNPPGSNIAVGQLLATQADLEARLGAALSGTALTQALAALADISAAVRAAAGKTWLDDAGQLSDVPWLIRAFVVRKAASLLQNPENYRSESETLGAYTHSVTFASESLTGGISLSASERREVRRAAKTAIRGSIKLKASPIELSDQKGILVDPAVVYDGLAYIYSDLDPMIDPTLDS